MIKLIFIFRVSQRICPHFHTSVRTHTDIYLVTDAASFQLFFFLFNIKCFFLLWEKQSSGMISSVARDMHERTEHANFSSWPAAIGAVTAMQRTWRSSGEKALQLKTRISEYVTPDLHFKRHMQENKTKQGWLFLKREVFMSITERGAHSTSFSFLPPLAPSHVCPSPFTPLTLLLKSGSTF